MIRYLVMDVDGSLTDGKIYMGNNGECHKAFSVKDGYVINYILKPMDIEPIIITARDSKIVENRCKELGIQKVYQGKVDKLATLQSIVGEENLGQCAYFGDDILDLKCMKPIKEKGGCIGCPVDSVKEVKAVADYIADNKAGEGALREFVEWLVEPKMSQELIQKKVDSALNYIKDLDKSNLQIGKYEVDDDFYYSVIEYDTKEMEQCKLESHRKYIDIQYIIEGEEVMKLSDTSALVKETEYDENNDIQFWKKTYNMTELTLKKDSYIVLYSKDAHMGGVNNNEVLKVKKIVGKVSQC